MGFFFTCFATLLSSAGHIDRLMAPFCSVCSFVLLHGWKRKKGASITGRLVFVMLSASKDARHWKHMGNDQARRDVVDLLVLFLNAFTPERG